MNNENVRVIRIYESAPKEDELVEALKDAYNTLDYIENELTYELCFKSGKLDVACIYARETMDKLLKIIPKEPEPEEGENTPF